MEKEVKHGISLLPDCRPDRRSAADYYDDVLALSRAADEYGLDYVKMTEHYLGDYGGYCPSPLTFLAAVAAQTRRIRLMTGCVLPAFHHPVQLAAHAAMVDVISHGRLDIGFARAWLPYEFEALGVPLDTSRARYEATIRAVHGGSGPQPQVAVSLPLYVAESDEAAYRSALPHLREYLDVTTRAARSWSRTQSTNYPGYEAMADAFGRIGDDELRCEGTAAIGGPDTVIEAVEALRRDLSADVCLWQIDFGGQDRESMERSLGLFAEKVLPSVR
jgi:alkanesulfonate monooxygenase SsuD/methylene tetrahydromethanopterin reductase-like flavin-dependent oxidoreductase (luciferase family)